MSNRQPRPPLRLLAAALVAGIAPQAPGHAQQVPRPAAPPVSSPAASPNFSGTWTLVPARSDFGGQRAPARLAMRVRHVGTSLEVAVVTSPTGGVDSSAQAYVLGAPAVTETHPWGRTWRRAALDGGELTLADGGGVRGLEFTRTDRWTLAPDGRTLTVARTTVTTATGTRRLRLVFAKR